MHEFAAMQALLAVVLDAAEGAGRRRVLAVDVVVGNLTTMFDDSVQFYFELLSRDTMAAGAALRLHRDVAVAACCDCGHCGHAQLPLSPYCEACGGMHVRVTGGNAFLVESIEVDDAGTGGNAGSQGE